MKKSMSILGSSLFVFALTFSSCDEDGGQDEDPSVKTEIDDMMDDMTIDDVNTLIDQGQGILNILDQGQEIYNTVNDIDEDIDNEEDIDIGDLNNLIDNGQEIFNTVNDMNLDNQEDLRIICITNKK